MHLYNWNSNGTLTEAGMLEGSKGPVSSLAFTPDGSLLAAGDVSLTCNPWFCFTSDNLPFL